VAHGETDFVSDRASALSVGAIFFVVVLGHLTLFPNVADLDGFYHIGHARAYLEGSIFDPSLPWATRSIIRDLGGDLWWGFHILLLPFAAVGSVASSMRSAAALLTLSLGLTVFAVLRRHGIRDAGWWAALFLIAVPNIFFRYLMVRPHVISLAASIALLSVLVRGRWWHVLLLSALISWVHLSLFWIAPGLVIAYALARIPVTVAFGREKPDTGVPIRYALLATVAGTAIGWLLRPEPIAAGALLNVQLVRLFARKATEEPLTFAAELAPIGLGELTRTTWLFAAAWVAAVVTAARSAIRGTLGVLGQGRATFVVTGLLVSTAFLGLSLLSARRAMEQWVAFGFVTLPFLWTVVLTTERRRALRVPLAVLLAGYLVWGGWRHSLNVSQVAFPAHTLEEVSDFLAANSEPGELVFHAKWDNFGPLFAHNRTNRYLGGMDPIFQFAHDPRSYWEFFYLSADVSVEWTCDAYPCVNGVATDTYRVLREHFGARWVLVEPRRNPRLSLYLLNDPRFALALETQREAVFEVLPDSTLPDQLSPDHTPSDRKPPDSPPRSGGA